MTAISAIKTLKEMGFHGIRATDPERLVGLRNPERGFRIGTVFAEPKGSPFPDGRTADTCGPENKLDILLMNATLCTRSSVLAESQGESRAALITNFGVAEQEIGAASV